VARLTFLNKKKVKEIFSILDKQWGLKKGFEKNLDYTFMINSKDKIYIINKQIADINIDVLRIDSMGLYFGERRSGVKNSEIRLSIEGSQIVGPFATKNVVEISDGLKRLWIRGYDIEVKESGNFFAIVSNSGDYLGCGRLKEGKLLNHIPKSRRVRSED